MLKGDDLLVPPVRLHDRVEHLVFGQFLAKPLDHHDRAVGAGDDEIQVALLHLVDRRQCDEFAFDPGKTNTADRTQKRQAGENQGGRGPDHGKDVGVILPVRRDRSRLDLNLLAIGIREKGTDGAIDQSRGQNFLGSRAAFTLDEASREFARGIHLFAIIDGEREEVESFPTRPRDRRDQRHRVAEANHHGSPGLFCESSGFNRDDFAPDITLDCYGSAGSGRHARHGMHLRSPALLNLVRASVGNSRLDWRRETFGSCEGKKRNSGRFNTDRPHGYEPVGRPMEPMKESAGRA